MPSKRSEEPTGLLGIYVHFPFCSIRCSYCDFPTVSGKDDLIEPYLDAIGREISQLQPDLPPRADTVFFGGGTPSRLTAGQVRRLLGTVRRRFRLPPDAEVTLEGNPESLTRDRLAGYRDAGITRVSVGVQSLDDSVLRRAGRAHDAAGALRALRDAREAGGVEVSADLIVGLPGERLSRWPATVRRVLEEEPDHVSVYLLESDKDTPLARAVRAGRVAVADDEALAEAYESTVDEMERGGWSQYEISNFSRPGKRSRHNLKYWSDEPFAGFGNGAHGYVGGKRRANRRDIRAYMERALGGVDPVEWSEEYDPGRRLTEAIFLGLRRAEGIDTEALARKYGDDPRERWAEAWSRGREAGLIEVSGTVVRLTRRGRLRSNELFAEFV
jgi:oxygen-independent coproporphyrinogen-3 oxidase